jgi:hypothetical protein
MSVHKMWSLKRYASSASITDYQKDEEDCDRPKWFSRSWTWNAMPAHGPRHSNISMTHIEILNGSRDKRYWIKAPYQLKYQGKGESSKIQDVNVSALPAQHEDLVN